MQPIAALAGVAGQVTNVMPTRDDWRKQAFSLRTTVSETAVFRQQYSSMLLNQSSRPLLALRFAHNWNAKTAHWQLSLEVDPVTDYRDWNSQ